MVVTLRELTDENRAAVLALRVALVPLEAAHRQAPPRPRLRLRGRPAGREARPSRGGAIELLTSYVPENGGPAGFYRRLGFEPTGELDANGQVIVRLLLA